MRRIVPGSALAVLALALAMLAAAPARAETQWVERDQLRTDPADPAVLRFTVEIRETASYEVRLLVRGESEREIRFDLLLEPDDGGPARTVHFSFTGRGCGWQSWLRATGGERVELEAGPWLGTLSPMDQKDFSVGLLTLDPSP